MQKVHEQIRGKTNLIVRDRGFKCIKLQNPPRVHSPNSYCRQQASLKSVTGDSSAIIGRPDNNNCEIVFYVKVLHIMSTMINVRTSL